MGDPNGPWPRRGGEIGAGTAPPRPPSQARGAVGRGDRAAERSGRAFRSRRWGRRLKRRGPPAKALGPPVETARPSGQGGAAAGRDGAARRRRRHGRGPKRRGTRAGGACPACTAHTRSFRQGTQRGSRPCNVALEGDDVATGPLPSSPRGLTRGRGEIRGSITRDVRRDGSEAPLRPGLVRRPCALTLLSQVTR